MDRKRLLPVGMAIQTIFTVCGGGMFLAGLIEGFYLGWDMAAPDNKGKISLLLAIFGGLLLFVGIFIMILLYKAIVEISKEESEAKKKEQSSAQISESDRVL